MSKRRILGPFPAPPLRPMQVSRFGVIPKRSQPGKWRLILDLSFPEDSSVNTGVSKELSSLRYPSIDMAVTQILQAGKDAQLSKLDIKDAYRIIPVHPEDWGSLGMHWQGQYFLDTRLPFGLRSAPKIFTALADAIQWLIRERGVECCIHYLDHYLFVEKPHTPARALHLATTVLTDLGVPLAPEKVEGPDRCLVFLGIELDSQTMTARLPQEKLQRLETTLNAWQDKKACRKRELLSLLGVLHHPAMVVRFGRIFVRRIIELSKLAKEDHHFVRLNKEFRSDLQWWRTFLPRWNGSSFLLPVVTASPDVWIYSDASGSWGYGAWSPSPYQWFHGSWPSTWVPKNITAKELLPIVLAAATWGPQWHRLSIHFRCDNIAIVQAISSGKSTEPLVMHLLRGLHLFAMEYRFCISATHIAGKDNGPADALSRNRLSAFFAQVPEAPRDPAVIPQTLLQLFLVKPPPDWLSANWRQQLTTTLEKVSQNPQPKHTAPAKSST